MKGPPFKGGLERVKELKKTLRLKKIFYPQKAFTDKDDALEKSGLKIQNPALGLTAEPSIKAQKFWQK